VALNVEIIKPDIGAIVHAGRPEIFDKSDTQEYLDLLEKHGALIFPGINLNDEEQLAFTDKLGARINFTKAVPGGSAGSDVYNITLDKKLNNEPEYVYGTFFWHLDGITSPNPPPKASILSCRRTAPKGGQTEFCNTYAAYDALPEEEKAEIEGLRVVHSVVAAVREVAKPEDIDPVKAAFAHEHPLVWTHKSGRKSLLVGYTADYVVGMSKPAGRALLARLLEWTGQPRFTYRHQWKEGDLAVWDNTGALHRVIPYDEASGRLMHRTSLAGIEEVA